MLVRPGSEVAVSIETTVDGVDRNQIQKSLGEAISRAGWKVNSRAPITLVAKIGRGEPQQLHYRSMGQPLGSGGSTATLNPFTAELEIRRGGDVLWQRASSNHVPSLLRLEEGETVQDAVKRYEKPNPEFFGMLNLPPRIPKPEIAQQVGMSTLENGPGETSIPRSCRAYVREPAELNGGDCSRFLALYCGKWIWVQPVCDARSGPSARELGTIRTSVGSAADGVATGGRESFSGNSVPLEVGSETQPTWDPVCPRVGEMCR
jgi:hypothetical protein